MLKIKFIALLLSLITAVSVFSACQKDPADESGNIEDEAAYYDPNAGINFDKAMEPLASAGGSTYRIVIPSDATPAEENAANELQNYIRRSASVTLPVMREADLEITNAPLIAIGNTQIFKNSGFSTKNLNLDGFIIRHCGSNLIIKGQRDRGTIYGVYDFLEKVVGIKFVTAEDEYIPVRASIPLYEMNVKETPTFMIRGHFTNSVSTDLLFASKMRMTTPHQSSLGTEKYGGAYADDWSADFHSFNAMIPHNVFYPIHPEWYSQKENWQPVFSNGLNDDGTIKPDTSENQYMINEVIRWIKNKILTTDTKIYFLGQEDNQNPSKHPDCIRQQELFGGYAGQIIVFVNAVAREIKEWMEQEGIEKEVYFATFAYQYTMGAPVKKEGSKLVPAHPLAVPREDVYIQLAPITASYNETMNDTSSTTNAAIYDTIKGWNAITDRFFMYDYSTNFHDFVSWFPNTNVIIPNLKFYREFGANSIMSNAATLAKGWYQESLNTYIMSKAMWNPDRDLNALISEFNAVYAGPAGQTLDEFVNYMTAHFETIANAPIAEGRPKLGASIYASSSPWIVSETTLDYPFITGAYRYVDKAQEIIESETSLTALERERYFNNIERVRIMIDYMKFKNYDAIFEKHEKIEFSEEFVKRVEKLGIARLSENQTFTDFKIQFDLNF